MPRSDRTYLSLRAAPNAQIGSYFGSERFEAIGRALPVGTCQAVGSDDGRLVEPTSTRLVDVGAISVTGEMQALVENPLQISWYESAQSYLEVALLSSLTKYQAGSTTVLTVGGSPQLSALTVQALAPEALEILSPATSAAGQVQNISKTEPLTIRWRGGDTFDDVVIALVGEHCAGGRYAVLFCHASNDGEYTVEPTQLASFDWGNYVSLRLLRSTKTVLPSPEWPDAAWSLRAVAEVPVYYVPGTANVGADCAGPSPAPGGVGRPCGSAVDCGGGCCIAPVSDGVLGIFADGYCSLLECADGGAPCPDGSVCTVNPYTSQYGFGSYCAKKCSQQSDCRDAPAYMCMKVSAVGRCVPAVLP